MHHICLSRLLIGQLNIMFAALRRMLLKVVNYKEEAKKSLPAALYRRRGGSYF